MSKQYELSILRQALQDIKLRVGEMEEWLNESSEKPREPMLEVGQKVLVQGHHEVADGTYTILQEWEDGCYDIDFVHKRDRYGIDSAECSVFQPLLSGPFNASRIPVSKIPGYMVWDNTNKLWRSVEQLTDGIILDSKIPSMRTFFHNGCFDGYLDSPTILHFQPPEQPKTKVSPEPWAAE